MSLLVGGAAPDFTLEDQDGTLVRLADYRGRWLVLYSYPRDNTPGCTQEAKDFSGLLEEFRALGAEVMGVSPDKPACHRGFQEKQGLGLRLLSDPGHLMLEPWGAWGLKKFMGREFLGVLRTTWLVDPQGGVAARWSKVKVKGHAQEVLETLRARLAGG